MSLNLDYWNVCLWNIKYKYTNFKISSFLDVETEQL